MLATFLPLRLTGNFAGLRVDVQLYPRAAAVRGAGLVDAVLAFDFFDVAVAGGFDFVVHLPDRQPLSFAAGRRCVAAFSGERGGEHDAAGDQRDAEQGQRQGQNGFRLVHAGHLFSLLVVVNRACCIDGHSS